MDYNWEAPTNTIEAKHYGQLLSNTKKMFRAHGLMVTMAVHPYQHLGQVTYNSADRIHLMAYDAPDQHSTMDFVVSSVSDIAVQGLSPEDDGLNTALLAKVALGIPAYGRNRNDLDDVLTYADIMRDHRPGPEMDELPSGMYFNGIMTVQKKARWAIRNGLNGVMVWEIGQDTKDDTSILRALRRVQDKVPTMAIDKWGSIGMDNFPSGVTGHTDDFYKTFNPPTNP